VNAARPDPPVIFACDAMLGALARWLRAAGYDCSWSPDIDDDDLVDLARREGAILLTADTGILRRNVIRRREVRAVFVPRDLARDRQAALILETLGLPRRPPRCMACGGELETLSPEAAQPLVPPGAWRENRVFFRCRRCGKTLWPGSHWRSIDRRLRALGLGEAAHPDPSQP